MRTTNYLKLSALVLGSAIAGCSGNNDASTGPTNVGGDNTVGTGGKANGGGGTSVGGTTSSSTATTGGANVGGNATGGVNNAGGNATGGLGVGGAATGGVGVGGAATGGVNNAGGNATGGTKTNTGGVNNAGGNATGGLGVGGGATGGAPPTTGGRTGTGGAPPTTGGTSTVATGGTPATGGGTGCSHAANVLSDFENTPNTTWQVYPVTTAAGGAPAGIWYAYLDKTDGCSGQVPTVPASPATVMAGAAPASAVSGAGGPHAGSDANCNKNAFHSSISGCQYYSGFGASLFPSTTVGSTVKSPINLSNYDGVSLWIKAGSGTQGPLYMEFVTQECVPSGDGGTALKTVVDQYNCHGHLIKVGDITTSWQQIYVPFFTTGSRWFPTAATGGTTVCATSDFCEAPMLNTQHLLAIQFSLEDPFNTTPTAYSNYDVWVDDVALYKFSDAPANAGLATWTQSGNNAFPKNTTYTGCTKPTGADGKLLQDAYIKWKAKYVVSDHVISPEIDMNGTTPTNPTVSEGMGYGMLIAVYMGDKPLFDALLGYWKGHGSAQSMLMNWKIGGAGGSGSATDADEDVAFALAMAVKQWGTSYQTDLTAILGQFLANDVSGGYLKPGNTFGGQNETNPSYFAPAFYKYFATIDTANAAAWNTLTTNVYTQLANITGSNGLVPAWCSTNCTVRGDTARDYTDEDMYQYDSHRTPWRIGLDACWNNEAKAKTYLNAVVGFFAGKAGALGAAGGGLSTLGDIYKSDGTVNTDSANNSMSLVGCAGVGAMGSTAANAATFRDRAWQFLLEGQYSSNYTYTNGVGTTKPGYTYYNATVGLLTAMTMSGNFYLM